MKRVMLVDDSRAMRLLLKRAMRQAGYNGLQICEAGDGLEALDVFEEPRPELILCDWNMPRMSGIEFLRAFRAKGYKTPFIFITTECTPAKRQEARDAGAHALLAKPLKKEDVQKELDSFLF